MYFSFLNYKMILKKLEKCFLSDFNLFTLQISCGRNRQLPSNFRMFRSILHNTLTLFDFKIFEFTRSESVYHFSSSPVIFIACEYNEPCPSVTLSFLRVTKIFYKARSQEVDKKFDGNEKQAKKKKK